MSQRGFTLTEVAIVLGVMGILLGGIWVLASQTWENERQEQLREEISSVVKGTRAYFQGQNGMIGSFATITPQLIGANVISGDMTRNIAPCASICADHPWGAPAAQGVAGSFGVCAWNYGATTNCTTGISNASADEQQLFAIELQGMPPGACVKAAMHNSGADTSTGFYDVYINGVSMLAQNHGLPVLASDAETNCVGGDTVDFIYRLVPPQS